MRDHVHRVVPFNASTFDLRLTCLRICPRMMLLLVELSVLYLIRSLSSALYKASSYDLKWTAAI